MQLLMLGDVVSQSGCDFLQKKLPAFKKFQGVDVCIANGENAAKGNGLTPAAAGPSVTFEEAECTLVCKKLFCQTLDPANIPGEIVDALYKTDAPHDLYIGEVVDILKA